MELDQKINIESRELKIIKDEQKHGLFLQESTNIHDSYFHFVSNK